VVADLAAHKAVDLRDIASCWLSQPITERSAGIQFARLLCFEPSESVRATEFVGDIFRSLMPFIPTNATDFAVAMPLVSTGTMRLPGEAVLQAILEAAMHWMALGLPLKTLKIVIYDPAQIAPLREVWQRWCALHAPPDLSPTPDYRYDVFISYAHKDRDKINVLVGELVQHRPGLRIFLDRLELNPGAAWQQQIYEALDDCRKVIAVYSPDYLTSTMCQEEFNIARYRERDLGHQLLFPIMLYHTKLPTYMAMTQYEDCHDGDDEQLRKACTKFLNVL